MHWHAIVRVVYNHLCTHACTPSKRHIVPITHARVQVWVRVLCTIREYTSVCFHITIKKECPYINTTVSFIFHPMWDNVSLSHSTSIFPN
ncbi:hypothetical protein Hanom_Chr06g00571051 [Helianthus anomalus]